MSRKHKTQHKPEREERKGKELQDLKRDKHKLEKQVARLRKQLIKAVTDSEDAEAAAQEEEAEPTPVKAAICFCGGTSVTEIVGPAGKVYQFCGTCKKRLA